MSKIILSKPLISILNKVDDKISKFLLDIHSNDEILDLKYSYVGCDADSSMLNYLPINKEKGLTDDEKWTSTSRTSVKIGRVVRAILLSKSLKFVDSDIETFVTKYRCALDKGNFILTSGEDFGKYYSETKYQTGYSGSSLWNSCMRFEKCQDWFTLYKSNPEAVGALYLLNEAGNVEGRAVVWSNVMVNGVKGTYMDRIYSITDGVAEKFKQYASARGWWHKTKQGNEYNELSNGKIKIDNPKLEVQIRTDANYHYNVKSPYVDSMRQMKFVDNNGKTELWLTNRNNSNSYRHSYENHQSGLIHNNNYSHPMDKPFSLSQITGTDFTKILKIDECTYKDSSNVYKVLRSGTDIDNAIMLNYVNDPSKWLDFHGFNLEYHISTNFYKEYSNEIFKYANENKSKILKAKCTKPEFALMFDSMTKEDFLKMVQPFLDDERSFLVIVKYFQRYDSSFSNVITSPPYNYNSWNTLEVFNKLNRDIFKYGYDAGKTLSLYTAFGTFLEDYGPEDLKEKFFGNRASFDTKEVLISNFINKRIRMNIMDFLHNTFKNDVNRHRKLDKFINLADTLKAYTSSDTRKIVLSCDNKEHIVGRHFIYKVE